MSPGFESVSALALEAGMGSIDETIASILGPRAPAASPEVGDPADAASAAGAES